ncbi:unannotated protein [freshwater metagenome]|uniref:Unannotated protein n=1 Tax=freshwater metagenome TaxID=449393 RepID=A0A6J7BL06_9ZZZZ
MKFFGDTTPMRFGLFMGPYHRPHLNPSIAFEYDMQTIMELDRLGFHEVWIGEHHSGGVETIGNPELMIAAAAQVTKHIKLGTGVNSLPYHNPFMAADRIAQLSHMTRGRAMLGVGPGQLLQDCEMIGLDPLNNRERLDDALGIVIRLLKGETVTQKSDWYDLREARLQMLPYDDFAVAVVSAISPSGAMTAGKHGAGLISVAATHPLGIEKLNEHWGIVEELAGKNGKSVDRSEWRLMGPMHIAETAAQAKKDVEYGLSELEDYRAHINPGGDGAVDYFADDIVDMFNESGAAVIGTPEMAIAQIQRLLDKTGGFGTYMLMGVDWAPQPAQLRSLQLFAEEVMPHFNGQGKVMRKSFDDVMGTGFVGAQTTARGQAEARQRYLDQRDKPAV